MREMLRKIVTEQATGEAAQQKEVEGKRNALQNGQQAASLASAS